MHSCFVPGEEHANRQHQPSVAYPDMKRHNVKIIRMMNDTATRRTTTETERNADTMRTWMLCMLCCGLMLIPDITPAATTTLPLRVAVTTMRPPFAFRTEHGALIGFDVAVARALCSEIGQPCLVAGIPEAEAFARLARGELDMVFAASPPDPTLAGRIAFSESYYRAHSVFICRTGPDGVTAPPGRVAAQTASRQYAYLAARRVDAVSLQSSSSLDTLWTLLQADSVDGVLADNLLSHMFLLSSQGEGFDTCGAPSARDAAGSELRIALPRDRDELAQAVNHALRAIRRNGIYTGLTSRYFLVDLD